MGFERFSSEAVSLRRDPWVTLQKRGVISLNRSAYATLIDPYAVELLYDADRQIVGLRKVDVRHPGARFVRSPTGKIAGPFVVSASAFLRHYALKLEVSRRWSAYLEDETLCIDLQTEGVAVTSNRAKPPHSDR